MGIIKTQSIQNSIITYIGIALGFISTLYLFPNILSTDEYGLTRVILAVAFIFTEFTHLGMKNIAIKFFPEFENKENKHNGFLFLVLFIPLIGYIISLGVLFSFDDFIIQKYTQDSTLFGDYFLFLIPLIAGILYFDVLNSYIRANKDSVPGSVVNEVILRILVIALLILHFYEYLSFQQFMTGFVCSYLFQPVMLTIYLFRTGSFNIKPNFDFLNKTLMKRIGNYGVFVLLGGMTHIIVNNIDILMLGSLAGLTNTGIYTIAFYIGSVIVVPQKSVGKIAPSLLSRYLHSDNIPEVEHIYKSSSLNQLVAGFLIFTGIWANLDNLIDILPTEYAGGRWVVIIIGISKLFDMAGGVNGNIIMHSRYYKFNMMATSVLIFVSIGLNYVLIPLYGITGAAIATAISLLIYNLVKSIYVWYQFSIQPLSPKVIPIILISAAILLISLQVDRIGNLYIDIILRSAIITVIYSVAMVTLNVSDEVNKLWRQILNVLAKK
ncbi:MAG: hypothetical protein FH748_02390 [Balneolaceae bacterium]|nr:hypothetical protein [Balneolaceae bacterium]